MRPRRPLDLLLGLPLAALAGLVVGTLATFKARVGVATGVPYGLVLSLLLVAVFVAAVRVGTGARAFAAAAGAGLLVAVYVLATPGPGSSAVVLDDTAGHLWLTVPALLAVLAVAPPLPPVLRPDAAARPAPGSDGILAGHSDEGSRP